MDNTYPRELQCQIQELIDEKDIAINELTTVRKMTKTFKVTEEKSKKMIETLQAKYEMARDEKIA